MWPDGLLGHLLLRERRATIAFEYESLELLHGFLSSFLECFFLFLISLRSVLLLLLLLE